MDQVQIFPWCRLHQLKHTLHLCYMSNVMFSVCVSVKYFTCRTLNVSRGRPRIRQGFWVSRSGVDKGRGVSGVSILKLYKVLRC